eukprot:2333415-Pleurochrysis_carterae.AAC.1
MVAHNVARSSETCHSARPTLWEHPSTSRFAMFAACPRSLTRCSPLTNSGNPRPPTACSATHSRS